jgi:predicted extracellular nuclease
MQEEIRFATFNVCNLAPPGEQVYDNLAPYTQAQYEAKLNWTARQIDLLDADVIGFQEIFSQDALRQALARTQKYRDAWHVGFDPDRRRTRRTPSVALVSRLPLAESGVEHPQFPSGVTLPHEEHEADRFARPVVHAVVQVRPGLQVDVVVVHLKSKRPEWLPDDENGDPQQYAMACLRSLVRRGTEAVALRVLLSNLRKEPRRARVVLGDFNDTAEAVTTDIVLGAGAPLGDRFYDAFRIQRGARSHESFSTVHEGNPATIDHILVSAEFNGSLPGALGEVREVRYLNSHLVQGVPEASDHGQVVATIRLY